jgi:rRNA processing protein Gar1
LTARRYLGGHVFEDETPVAWPVTPLQAPVVAADGSEIGIVEKMLGDEEEDIFHGIVMRRSDGGEQVEIPARRITRTTTRRVITDLTASEVAALPAYPNR